MEFGGETAKVVVEGGEIKSLERPLDTHEEEAGFRVLVLVSMGDVGAVAVEQTSYGGDQAFAVGGVDQENGRAGHGSG